MGNKIPGSDANWEEGVLGLNESTAERADAEETAAIERATGTNMQPISMRLPQDLINVLKEIAKYRGIGYQPMVRDLLQRWAVGEIKTILNERLIEAQKREEEVEKLPSLAGDLRKSA
ncbi:vacuolar-type H+-ATPase subunit C/Vma6 [Rhodanobacter sp. K2T2]|uniref:CopG family antitoxin n=1 Tax=Rhodanobacter sp. K2T2 TaxID=2723085 RepID=UPI0015CB4220|nr:CopG family antitoxin [Rhodanobacter sp. K2T2]NYE27308.1 vacuolar-type H+-ATPase subunit C/Vma6 [Rhodanobacter sp. K2T2]